MSQPTKTYTCRLCGEPTTAHKPECAAAPKTNGSTRYAIPTPKSEAVEVQRTSPSPAPASAAAAHKRISDRDAYMRPEYLKVAGERFTIQAWHTETIPHPVTHKPKPTTIVTLSNRKLFIVNPTNLRTLAALFDDDEQASIGQEITLLPAITNGKATILVARTRHTPKTRSVIVEVGEEEDNDEAMMKSAEEGDVPFT